MKKIYIQNLGMIITEKCNLDCRHCMRGAKCNHSMSEEVIKKTLEQIGSIGNLCICGGEPTMAVDVLEKIFSYIIDNKILVDEVTMVINGTIYSDSFIKALDMVEEYISTCSRENRKAYSTFTISYDKYHVEEIKRLNLEKEYLENFRRYSESKYFYGMQILKPNLRLYKEGNAESLDSNLTVDLKPIDIAVTYAGKLHQLDMEKGLCNIGPLITVNTDGLITECDASFINQEILYNYGNVFDNSIEEIALERGKILRPKKWYKECGKIALEHKTYNE